MVNKYRIRGQVSYIGEHTDVYWIIEKRSWFFFWKMISFSFSREMAEEWLQYIKENE